MKKILVLLLVFLLSLTALAADYTPDNTPVYINGVRVAFFDEQNQYLSLRSVNGIVYAPFLSLMESLQIQGDVKVHDNGAAAVSIKGVQAAFFDANGQYLAPLLIDNVVYVPLRELAASAGIGIKEESGALYLSAAAPEQTAAPTVIVVEQTPLYGRVPVGLYNYTKYFNFQKDETDRSYETETSSQTTYVTAYDVKVSCHGITGYTCENVSFSIKVPARVGNDMVFSGKLSGLGSFKDTKSYQTSKSFRNDDVSSLWEAQRYKTDTYLYGSFTNNMKMNSISGLIVMPYQDAQTAYADLMKQAKKNAENGNMTEARKICNDLISAGCKEAEQLLNELSEIKASAEEMRRENNYQTACTALENKQFEKAIDLLKNLGDYRDSKALLSQATEAKLERDYNNALGLFTEGKESEAIALFKTLGDYKDSSDLLTQAEKQLLEKQLNAAYALADMSEQMTEAQKQALSALSELVNKNAMPDVLRDKLQAFAADALQNRSYEFAISLCDLLPEALADIKSDVQAAYDSAYKSEYDAAEALRLSFDYAAASEAFAALGSYSDSAEKAANCAAADAKLKQQEEDYAAAVQLENAGDYAAAYTAFNKLGDYSNSRVHAACCLINEGNLNELYAPKGNAALYTKGDVSYYLNTDTGKIVELRAVYSGWNGNAASVKTENNYALISTDCTVVAESNSIYTVYGEGLFIEDKCRIITDAGERLPGTYSEIKSCDIEGYYTATTAQGLNAILSPEGKVVVETDGIGLMMLTDGKTDELYYTYRITEEKKGKTVYHHTICRLDGTVVYNLKDNLSLPMFGFNKSICSDKATRMFDGVIGALDENGKISLINIHKGKTLVSLKCKRFSGFSKAGLALIQDDQGKNSWIEGVVNNNGKTIVPIAWHNDLYITNDIVFQEVVQKNGTTTITFYNASGKKLHSVTSKSEIYASAGAGVALVRYREKSGTTYIDEKGVTQLKDNFRDSISQLNPYLACVKANVNGIVRYTIYTPEGLKNNGQSLISSVVFEEIGNNILLLVNNKKIGSNNSVMKIDGSGLTDLATPNGVEYSISKPFANGYYVMKENTYIEQKNGNKLTRTLKASRLRILDENFERVTFSADVQSVSTADLAAAYPTAQ